MTKYLLSLPGAEKLFLFSERFTQDPLENYFGQILLEGTATAKGSYLKVKIMSSMRHLCQRESVTQRNDS